MLSCAFRQRSRHKNEKSVRKVTIMAASPASPASPASTGPGARKKKWKHSVETAKWVVPIAIALVAAVIAVLQFYEQSQQIAALQRTTPTGEMTGMTVYHNSGRQPAVLNFRDAPVLRQQIYTLHGTTSNVPDDGSLFMVIHDYGKLSQGLSDPGIDYYITPVTPSGINNWSTNVYIGEKTAPKVALSYRLTLYFCNSIDAAKILAVTRSKAIRNRGLSSLPYPSCKQLDSIFVTKG
jgi:hypothetical protein